jgi:hypothetical protein
VNCVVAVLYGACVLRKYASAALSVCVGVCVCVWGGGGAWRRKT